MDSSPYNRTVTMSTSGAGARHSSNAGATPVQLVPCPNRGSHVSDTSGDGQQRMWFQFTPMSNENKRYMICEECYMTNVRILSLNTHSCVCIAGSQGDGLVAQCAGNGTAIVQVRERVRDQGAVGLHAQ